MIRQRLARSVPGALLFGVNALVCVFLLAPLVVVVLASVNTTEYLTFPPKGFTFRWYEEFFADEQFVTALWVSVRLAVVVTLVTTVLGTATALGLDRMRSRLAGPVRGLSVAPLLVPSVTFGIAALVFFSKVKLAGTFFGLVAAHTVLALPFVVVIVGAALQTADRSVEDAARNLGASRVRTVTTVTLPLVRGSIGVAAFFAFIISFDEVTVTLFLSGPRLETLPMKILLVVEYETTPTVAAISTLLILATAVAATFLSRSSALTSYLQRR